MTDERTTRETYLNRGQIQNYVGDKLALDQVQVYLPAAGPTQGRRDPRRHLDRELSELHRRPGRALGLHYSARNVFTFG